MAGVVSLDIVGFCLFEECSEHASPVFCRSDSFDVILKGQQSLPRFNCSFTECLRASK